MDIPFAFSLDELNTYRENNQFEVKSARGGLPGSIWETYSAFANSEGGVIILGIKEKKDGSLIVEGLEDAAKLIKDFWNMVNNLKEYKTNNVALKENDVALNSTNVVPNSHNVAPNSTNVALKENDVALSLNESIIWIIKNNPNIKREDIAQQLSVTKKTIERHLKDIGIIWKGHSKTGYWVIPDNL